MGQVQYRSEKRNRPFPSSVARKTKKRNADAISPIAAQLTGSNTATALGLTGRGNAPVIDLCSKLSDAGHDPRLPLHVYRGATLALIVSSVGAAAGLEINGDGTGFRPRCEPDAASPMRQNLEAASEPLVTRLGHGHD
jgi:hypothetical protein